MAIVFVHFRGGGGEEWVRIHIVFVLLCTVKLLYINSFTELEPIYVIFGLFVLYFVRLGDWNERKHKLGITQMNRKLYLFLCFVLNQFRQGVSGCVEKFLQPYEATD